LYTYINLLKNNLSPEIKAAHLLISSIPGHAEALWAKGAPSLVVTAPAKPSSKSWRLSQLYDFKPFEERVLSKQLAR
jgi:hypothetical protein